MKILTVISLRQVYQVNTRAEYYSEFVCKLETFKGACPQNLVKNTSWKK